MGHPSSTSSGHWRVFAAFIVLGSFILGATLAAAVLYARHVVETTVFKVARVADVRLRVGEESVGDSGSLKSSTHTRSSYPCLA
ncbi:MAG: hypothetical protein QM784_04315 [Polyangiaceae bacterium]